MSQVLPSYSVSKSTFAGMAMMRMAQIFGPVTTISTQFRSFPYSSFLLVRSGRLRYRPWGASLRSTIVPSVAGGVLLEEN